jgi:SAM-dependent methyltransferase
MHLWQAEVVGLYGDQILPRVIDKACNMRVAREQRARLCAGLAGEVVEIGFGSGLNVPFYPPEVTGVAAVEPADVAWNLAAPRVRAASVPVRRSGLDGQALPFEDDTFDMAVSAWTMCTIPDLGAALRELRRVLKPGGEIHFVEHGLAPDPRVQAWQHRLDPLQQRIFGGCHLTREAPAALRAAGFDVRDLDAYYEKGSPKFLGANSLGVAVSP